MPSRLVVRSFLFCLSLALSMVLAVSPAKGIGAERQWLFASLLQERKIVSFERNELTGELTRRAVTSCPAEPAIMTLAPSGKFLFTSLRSSGQLASFRIDAKTGELTLLSVAAGGADPAFLLADRQGRFLLSAYYEANQVCVHTIDIEGKLSSQPIQTIPTAEKAHGIALDSSNHIALVPHTGSNRIDQFFFDAGTGRLRSADPPYTATPLEYHPRHIAIHPNDRWAYANNEAGDSLTFYTLDLRTARLQPIQTLKTIPEPFDGQRNATARCEMTRDGRFVYVANRGHDSIAGFAVDPATGRLTSLGQTPTEKTPRSLTIDARARFLYAAGQDSGRIAAYRILMHGQLERFATYDAGPVAWCVLAADLPVDEAISSR